jgi:hypothetical protein
MLDRPANLIELSRMHAATAAAGSAAALACRPGASSANSASAGRACTITGSAGARRESRPVQRNGKILREIPVGLSGPEKPERDHRRSQRTPKEAGETLSRIARPSSMVAGRMICPVSANGAPDCKVGADKLCRSKGFKEGNSLNTDSAETCSAKVLIPDRTRKPDDCRRDNYVTRALCQ